MSSDFPDRSFFSPVDLWTKAPTRGGASPTTQPSRKEWIVALVLLLATLSSTTYAGLIFHSNGGGEPDASALAVFFRPSLLMPGFLFSIPFLSILLAHELGHFFACRYYGIRCTPPFFIPLPLSMAGTLGAFIKIRSPFPHRRALFDVGIAGPLAGFAVTLPVLFFGIAHSRLIPSTTFPQGINFGEPLIFRWIGALMLGYSPAHQVMIAHPAAMAAWFGLLATSLNLFPIWQLDGGHITYAILGTSLQKKISLIAVIALVFVSLLGWPIPSYLLFAILILIMGWRHRLRHPPTLADGMGMNQARIALGYIALAVFIVSFTPVPISIS